MPERDDSGPSTRQPSPANRTTARPVDTGSGTAPRRVLGDADRERIRTLLESGRGVPSTLPPRALAQLQAALGDEAAELSPEAADAADTMIAIAELAEVTGSTSIATALAQQPAVTRGLTLDGRRVDGLTEEELNSVAQRARGAVAVYLAPGILHHVLADGTFDLTTDGLIQLIRDVAAQYQQAKSGQPLTGDERYRRIAQALVTDDEQPDLLTATLGETALKVTSTQAGAINRFLADNPRFLAELRRRRVLFEFGSGKARAYGGGAYLDGVVHLQDLKHVAPDAFLRLVLHETGHATFQRILLADRTMPLTLDDGSAIGQLLRRVVLRQTYGYTPAGPPPRSEWRNAQRWGTGLTELLAIETSLLENRVLDGWRGMSADAKRLYHAWLLLREADGAELLGLDLGAGRRPDNRREYQAGKFTEFCAEVFMQAATGEVTSHLAVLEQRGDVDEEVKNAWRTVRDVLATHTAPILG
ncbi:hypothetical protein C6361_01555 [Plantactinospora sp. BC1]|uniref:hypothetical protein n=1 Tax=Plantactinospora sp. BC1 TaxID=2108470 RepID=UPI000D17CA2A|nr:hypothetical protein [Plantactinospora sp. BC1]AVT28398.1 hypothetical protein C6361_01555 [Plantactinospora sp. BC1]